MATKKENLDIYGDFVKLVQSGKLSHAYIFFGKDVEGVFDFSKKFANFLENNIFKISQKQLSDSSIIYPNEKGNIGIDEIRALQGFLYQTPVASKKRTAVIFNAQNLTNEAQSSLLKIIEEPPQNSLIILICDELTGLLPTITSRTHKIYFPAGVKTAKKRKAGEAGNGENPEEAIQKILFTLKKDPIKNADALKEVLRRLRFIKSFNLNNRLQLRFLNAFLKRQK